MASAHFHIHCYSPAFFSLVQVYASELVNSISVYPPAAAAQIRERQKGRWIKRSEVREQTVNINPKYSCVFPSEHTRAHTMEMKVHTTASIEST